METYAGIDLHSSNNYIGIIDGNDKRLYSKRHENRLEIVLKALAPFKKRSRELSLSRVWGFCHKDIYIQRSNGQLEICFVDVSCLLSNGRLRS
jgi:hypothetical protein